MNVSLRAPASTQDTVGLNMSCLAESGQPIFPWISLGGFDGKYNHGYHGEGLVN